MRSLESGCFIGQDIPALIPEQRLVDPERPMGMEEVLGTIAPVPERHRLGRRLFAGYVLVGTVGLLALLWRWMPWMTGSCERRMTQLQAMSRSPAGFIAVLGGYVLGGLVALPITLLIVLRCWPVDHGWE